MNKSAAGNVPPHVHSRSCEGVALIQYTDEAGTKRSWAISASLCPLRPDTEEGIREHVAKHLSKNARIERVDFLLRDQY
jgi:hypothetical protein